MSRPDEELTIRRILVALDGSHPSLAALEAAAELAASLEAELQGLFVEDVNLLRVAGSPIALEMRYPFGTTVRLDLARMERALRAQATQARRALAMVCEQWQVKWSFRVVRGEVAAEVLAAATEADLLSLGKASRPLLRRVRLGSTARAAAAQAPRSVLLLHKDMAIRSPVIVTYDGSPTARQALMMAARLAQNERQPPVVLILADSQDAVQQLRIRVSEWLRGRRLLAHYRPLVKAGLTKLIHTIRAEGNGILILSNTIVSPEALHTLLDEVECPVLLVR